MIRKIVGFFDDMRDWKQLAMIVGIGIGLNLAIYFLGSLALHQAIASGAITHEDVKQFFIILLAVWIGTRLGQ